jgi:hypothetical protein
MTGEERKERKRQEIEELAQGWGKLLAREAFPDGVGLDVDLFTMEEIAVAAAKSLVRGAVVSPRTVNQLGAEFGGQLAEERDRRTQDYQQRPLPRVAKKVDPPVPLAAVFCDGGRMRTRAAGGGHGVHQPHWRETKAATAHCMAPTSGTLACLVRWRFRLGSSNRCRLSCREGWLFLC